MNKKILISIGLIVVIVLAYWLISPIWRTKAVNESLPGSNTINDNWQTMDSNTKSDLVAQTDAMKDDVMVKEEVMPSSQPEIISKAEMVARAHDVQGQALFVKSGDDLFLRFENLKTINGPDLRIYLSSELNANDIVDLGPIRGTEGNVNYPIPAGTDLNKYKNVMIWCRAFSVLFSYAQLQ